MRGLKFGKAASGDAIRPEILALKGIQELNKVIPKEVAAQPSGRSRA